jgi:hypothetical protein
VKHEPAFRWIHLPSNNVSGNTPSRLYLSKAANT